ncbi:outer membrane protein assembly factor BamC [Candidatus Thioglobus sp.]|uniref:outer membrane protein assembly factor BamC n=1 Tax=Candidatus Thioglobus sp. TaxID=2026721 RepID=UPI003D11B580
MIKTAALAILTITLTGCFSANEKAEENKTTLGERNIKYYANKTVSSLEVPPDLTKPSSQNAFKLDNYVADIHQETISFSDKDNVIKASGILTAAANVEVKKSGERRWLIVDKRPEIVWNLSKRFLKSHGFAIKEANKKIGLIETDFLENRPDIPDQSLGMIRSMLKKAISTSYTLPIIDKYRIRIEPSQNGEKTSVHLSLTSMEEVATSNQSTQSENTIWQTRPKDPELEVEMLYRLMTFLGSDDAAAREKIIAAKIDKTFAVSVEKGLGGYAKLVFALNQYDTWENIGWALDQLNADVEDKDVKEGSFYINMARSEDKGVLSRIFGDDAIKKSFQIMVKQIGSNTTEVYFNDLSEENEQATVDFSYEFLGSIAKQF